MGPRNGVPATHSASQTRVNALLLSRGAPRGDDEYVIGCKLARLAHPILQVPSFGGAMISMSSLGPGTAPSAS
jgi:hypothetical protein